MDGWGKLIIVVVVGAICFALGRKTSEVHYVVDTRKEDSLLHVLSLERQQRQELFTEIQEHERDVDNAIDSVLRVIASERPNWEDITAARFDTGNLHTSTILTRAFNDLRRYRVGDTLYWSVRQSEIRDSLDRVFGSGNF